MPVAYVLDEVFAGHLPPRAHPERPERVVAVCELLRSAGLEARGRRVGKRRATDDELISVHAASYLEDLQRTVPGNAGWLDEDTFYSPGTWEAALCAAGAAADLSRLALDGAAPRGIAVVRPPGHHAERDHAMGFCLLNNVAIAAAAARAAGAARVAIIDWDVHHGNGTQHIFYDDPYVMFLSVHQFPFYPGTGRIDEIGEGRGRGRTVNVPLPAGCGDAEYRAVFDRVFAPAIRGFRPDLILISAGFDAYRDDPLAGMRLSLDGFADLATRAVRLADQVCKGRIVGVLEGGYDLRGVSGGMGALVRAMELAPEPAPTDQSAAIFPEAEQVIDAAIKAHHAAVPV